MPGSYHFACCTSDPLFLFVFIQDSAFRPVFRFGLVLSLLAISPEYKFCLQLRTSIVMPFGYQNRHQHQPLTQMLFYQIDKGINIFIISKNRSRQSFAATAFSVINRCIFFYQLAAVNLSVRKKKYSFFRFTHKKTKFAGFGADFPCKSCDIVHG